MLVYCFRGNSIKVGFGVFFTDESAKGTAMGKWEGMRFMNFPDFDEAEGTISQQRHCLTHHL